MNAIAVLRETTESGVAISLMGENLALKAAVRPPAELLAKIREHKAEIVALLRQGAVDELTKCSTLGPEALATGYASAGEPVLNVMNPEIEPRREWWNAPVEGWRDGKLTIRNIVSGVETTINLRSEEDEG
jgi:hypothetical protein